MATFSVPFLAMQLILLIAVTSLTLFFLTSSTKEKFSFVTSNITFPRVNSPIFIYLMIAGRMLLGLIPRSLMRSNKCNVRMILYHFFPTWIFFVIVFFSFLIYMISNTETKCKPCRMVFKPCFSRLVGRYVACFIVAQE